MHQFVVACGLEGLAHATHDYWDPGYTSPQYLLYLIADPAVADDVCLGCDAPVRGRASLCDSCLAFGPPSHLPAVSCRVVSGSISASASVGRRVHRP